MATRKTKPFRPGQTHLSARNLNAVRLEAIKPTFGSGLAQIYDTPAGRMVYVPRGRDWFLAEIDSTGKTDYSDCHYYVKKQELICSDWGGFYASDVSDSYYPSDFVLTITNLPEISDNTHLLRDGQEVVVFEVEDQSQPPVVRYFTAQTPLIPSDFLYNTSDSGCNLAHLKLTRFGAVAAYKASNNIWYDVSDLVR